MNYATRKDQLNYATEFRGLQRYELLQSLKQRSVELCSGVLPANRRSIRPRNPYILTPASHQYDGSMETKLPQIILLDYSITLLLYHYIINGYPTAVPGSWMPQESGELLLTCGNASCCELATTRWPAMNKASNDWATKMQPLECDTCKQERCRRSRVRREKDNTHREPPFTSAPYIVPFNLPKYHALQLRAMDFVRTANPPRQLLWVVAFDKPFSGDIKSLSGAVLE